MSNITQDDKGHQTTKGIILKCTGTLSFKGYLEVIDRSLLIEMNHESLCPVCSNLSVHGD